MHQMKRLLHASLVFIGGLFVSNCAVTPLLPDNDPVRVIFHNELPGLSKMNLSDCDYLGTLISSEGHWYDFLYIDNNIDIKTSVTFLEQAYHCEGIT
jgi:hypothetical protein